MMLDFDQQMNMYHAMYFFCGTAALVFLAIGIFLFIWLKIPNVVGELTGRNAQKAIADMTEENMRTGTLTSIELRDEGRRQHRKGRTGVLGTARLKRLTGKLPEGTAELSRNQQETEQVISLDFRIERSIVEIHTDEVI